MKTTVELATALDRAAGGACLAPCRSASLENFHCLVELKVHVARPSGGGQVWLTATTQAPSDSSQSRPMKGFTASLRRARKPCHEISHECFHACSVRAAVKSQGPRSCLGSEVPGLWMKR